MVAMGPFALLAEEESENGSRGKGGGRLLAHSVPWGGRVEGGGKTTDRHSPTFNFRLSPSLRPTTELLNMQLRRRRGDIRGEDGGEGLKRGREGGATTIPTSRSVAPSPHPSLPRERRRKGPSTPREDGGRGGGESFSLHFVKKISFSCSFGLGKW